MLRTLVSGLGLGIGLASAASGPWVISGNETKLDLVTGSARRVEPQGPDSLTLLDFGQFPPLVTHLMDVPNTVIGPPSNIAIAPGGRVALIADSIRMDPASATNWLPADRVHVLDLGAVPPRIAGQVGVGLQPSGMSISRDGSEALVANRASGTVSVLALDGLRVSRRYDVRVCEPAESVSDVAISPDGRRALASVQKGGCLAVLERHGDEWVATGRKVSVYGQPYRVVITPDGELGLTAGAGLGNGLDRDALTVVELGATSVRAVDHVVLGAVPESFEISPDGRLLAAVLMEGSNLPDGHPDQAREGRMVILERKGSTYRRVSEHAIGAIPEGVAFTSDGRHLVVQGHPGRELRLFSVRGTRVRDTGQRVELPGYGASLRASP